MFMTAIGDLLPPALGIMVSPVPIIAIVLVLGTKRASSNGPSFALGWIVGITVVSTVFVILSGSNESGSSNTIVYWIKVAFGIAFLVAAATKLPKLRATDSDADLPDWMVKVEGLSTPGALGMGLVLSAANPKNLALTLAGTTSITGSGLNTRQTVVATTIFVVLASLSVIAAVGFHAIAPSAAARPLERTKAFMIKYNTVIMFVILVVLGVKMLLDGVVGLRS